MPSKPETSFYGRVNKRLPVDVHVEKMHNFYRGGTPDIWYSGPSGDLWAEYKWIPKLPVKQTTPIKADLTGLQLLWLYDAWTKGRNVCVIVGSPQGCAILRDGAWRSDISHAEFKYTELQVTSWLIGQTHVLVATVSKDSGSVKSGVSYSNYLSHRSFIRDRTPPTDE
jgi:hypothetical protein